MSCQGVQEDKGAVKPLVGEPWKDTYHRIRLGWLSSLTNHQRRMFYTSRGNIDASFDFGYGGRAIDEMTVTVEDVLPQKGSTISFEYDFGDGWIHNVKVSSVSDEPFRGEDICVTSGKGACPPEDVGGVWGYAQMLDILSGKVDDPEEKASYEEWLGLQEGESYDPEDFDLAIANEDVEDLVALILQGKDDFL